MGNGCHEASWPQEGPICSERTRHLAGIVTPYFIPQHPRRLPGCVGCSLQWGTKQRGAGPSLRSGGLLFRRPPAEAGSPSAPCFSSGKCNGT